MTEIADPLRHALLTGLDDARTAIGLALAANAWSANDADILSGLDAAIALRRQADAQLLTLIREADARDLRCRFGQVDTRGLLRHRYGMSRQEARDLTAAATTLDRHPVTFAALASGALGLPHASAITTALASLPDTVTPDERAEAEATLVAEAPLLSPTEIAICGQRLKELLTTTPDADDPDEAARLAAEAAAADADAAARFARRGLTSRPDPRTGLRRITLLLDDETHTAFLAALDPLAHRHPDVDGIRDERTLTQRRVDALAELVDVALRSDQLPLTGGGVKPHVTVTIDWETLIGARHRAALLDDGSPLPPGDLRRLLCDADILPAVLGGDSHILDLGRHHRRHNHHQRRALALRDKGCVFPGCDRVASRCHAHHLTPWSHGGDTSVDNGALLCLYHHRRVHTEGWKTDLAANGYPQLHPPPWLDPSERPRQHVRFLAVRRH